MYTSFYFSPPNEE
jgi:hypothetical protein